MVNAALVSATIGMPFHTTALVGAAQKDRRLLVDAVGVAIAELLPASYRGTYGGSSWDKARSTLDIARRG